MKPQNPKCTPPSPFTTAERRQISKFLDAFSQLAVMIEQMQGPHDNQPTLAQIRRMHIYTVKQANALSVLVMLREGD